MSDPNIRLKRSGVPGKIPSIEQLQLGELAVNTFDAELYLKRERAGIGTDIVRIGAGTTVTNILYVTKDGNDTNTGKKLGDAKATIKGAIAEATEGTVIKVSSGSYVEDNPIELPPQVSIIGDSLREVSVTPLNSNEHLFLVSPGNYISDMSFTGTLDHGYAIAAFNPNEIRYFAQSPYVRNCTNFIHNSIGLKIDGEHAIGPIKSMVVDSFTQYNQGGIGVSITNEGYAQLVSLFTICNDIAVFCGSGGACDLTNSNSSFGNYALVADGKGPLKYVGIISEGVPSNGDTFVVDLNTPTLNIVNATYDNITGVLTAYTDNPHNFSVGMGITLSDLEFTCTGVGGISTYPSGNNGYVFETKTVAPGRYVDSYNLIQGNKLEIQDKSLASIAINHPDFVFPQDPGSSERFRYYDAYRLIQNNKTVIVDTAWSNTVTQYPGISGTQVKCKRDLGYFVDAISTDIFTGGNKYSRDFSIQYFTGPGSGSLSGEEQQTIYAFEQARNLMRDAITNNLLNADYTDLTVSTGTSYYGGGGLTYSNTDPLSCSDVQSNINNLVGIVTTIIGDGNLNSLNTYAENLGVFESGTLKCYRDIGYLIDAVSLDVRDYTNKNIRSFIKGYFDANGDPITNGITGEISESATAFNAVRDYSKKAITNQLNYQNLSLPGDPTNKDPGSCANVQTFIDNLIATVNSDSVGVATNKLNLPSVSAASTVFSLNVGVSTTPNQVYTGNGTAKINVSRPFDGQVIYFGELYYTIDRIDIVSEGSGYVGNAEVYIEDPVVDWGIPATAVAEVKNGSIVKCEMISNGRGYTTAPKVTISSPNTGINTATAIAHLSPTYYSIIKSTPVSNGISTVTVSDNLPYGVGVGTEVYFFKQSRVLASGHSLEYIGTGTNIDRAFPSVGGVPIQDNETDARNGGLVVFTTTDQSGNFRIGDGVVVNQQTGTISGKFYSKSLFSAMTPFILALGGD